MGPLLLAIISRAIIIRFGDTCRKAGFDCTGCRTAAPSLTEGHGRTPGLRDGSSCDVQAPLLEHKSGTAGSDTQRFTAGSHFVAPDGMHARGAVVDPPD